MKLLYKFTLVFSAIVLVLLCSCKVSNALPASSTVPQALPPQNVQEVSKIEQEILDLQKAQLEASQNNDAAQLSEEAWLKLKEEYNTSVEQWEEYKKYEQAVAQYNVAVDEWEAYKQNIQKEIQ